MQTFRRKTEFNILDSETPGGVPAPKKSVRPTRKSITNGTKRTPKENTKDIERRSSRNFFGHVDSSKRGRTGLHDAKREMQQEADDLIAFIESCNKESATERDGKVSATSQVLDLDVDLDQETYLVTSLPTSRYDTNWEVYQKCTDILQQFHASVKEYRLANSANGIETPSNEPWEKDIKELSKLNDYAKIASMEVLNSHIMPSSKTGCQPGPPKMASDAERIAWALLDNARLLNGDQSWGAVAQNVIKVFTKVLKLLSETGNQEVAS